MSSRTKDVLGARCAFTDLRSKTCAHCRGRPVEELDDRPVLDVVFESDGTHGACGVCGDDIVAGDYIGQYTTIRIGGGRTGHERIPVYAHYGCGR